jgi:hypothetical protein
MRKFTQAVSMECTKERYESDLRDKMLAMGYKENNITDYDTCTIVSNNYKGEIGDVSNVYLIANDVRGRYFIDHYNPQLFLAIAAMSDSEVPLVGMHWMCINTWGEIFSKGKIYKSECDDSITDNKGEEILEWTNIQGMFRPATLEELVSHYAKQAFDPNNWYVVVTEENREMVKEWFGSEDYIYETGASYGISYGDKTALMIRDGQTPFGHYIWKEITTAQFIEHVYSKLEKSQPVATEDNAPEIPQVSALKKTTVVYNLSGDTIAFRPDDIRIGGIQFSVAELQQIINIYNQEFPSKS